tara:strand:- start:2799 stop:3884 length:1086 start_codon:yes stop_codon:yes gene_type:complete
MGYNIDWDNSWWDIQGNKWQIQGDEAWLGGEATAERYLLNGSVVDAWDNNLSGDNAWSHRKSKFKKWAKAKALSDFGLEDNTTNFWYSSSDAASTALTSHQTGTDSDTDTTLGGGTFGQTGLTYSDLENLTPNEIFELLDARGAIPEGDTYSDWEDAIQNMPKREGIAQEDMEAYEAGVATDVYGFETDIARAGEDKATAETAYGLARERGEEDKGAAGEGARSDIYGLQGAGAKAKRAGMFGKGMGGGMSNLNQQDASGAMRASGKGVMSGLSSTVKGIDRGVENAGISRDADILAADRSISDANAELYGIAGTGEYAGQMVGGVHGVGGSAASDLYGLTDSADDAWETDMSGWISDNIS